MPRSASLVLAAPRVAAVVATATAVAPAAVIDVPGLGTLTGKTSSTPGVALFLGIPYAEPPVGELRWRSARPAAPWASPRDATRTGASCMGAVSGPLPVGSNASVSEDCLFLNVAAPAGAAAGAARGLPVAVWVHGGGYEAGSGDVGEYPIDRLVARAGGGLVAVTLNYRINVFGFLGSAALRDRDGGRAGNLGIDDQRVALRWVRDHIAAFGGDGRDVTLFGESAGGNAVINHLVQPASFGLYSKAIIESGTFEGSFTMPEAEAVYASLLDVVGCATGGMPCLLGKSAAEIEKAAPLALSPNVTLQSHPSANWGPVIDGTSLTDRPTALIAAGKYHSTVPVVVGSNREDDGGVLVGLIIQATGRVPAGYNASDFAPNLTEAHLDAWLRTKYGFGAAEAEQVRALYAASAYPYPADLRNYSHAWWAKARAWSDSDIGPCSARRLARALARGGTPGVYAYLFAHPTRTAIDWPGTGPGNGFVTHGAEIPYVFDDAKLKEAGDVAMAASVSGYWANFIRLGDPNGPSMPHWPAYQARSDSVLRLQTRAGGTQVQQGLRSAACDFWDQH